MMPDFIQPLGQRGRLDIIAGILHNCKSGMRKTRIMALTNLSYEQLLVYLNLCMRTGLLEKYEAEDDAERICTFYRPTAKGLAYLDAYIQLITIANSDRVLAPINSSSVQ